MATEPESGFGRSHLWAWLIPTWVGSWSRLPAADCLYSGLSNESCEPQEGKEVMVKPCKGDTFTDSGAVPTTLHGVQPPSKEDKNLKEESMSCKPSASKPPEDATPLKKTGSAKRISSRISHPVWQLRHYLVDYKWWSLLKSEQQSSGVCLKQWQGRRWKRERFRSFLVT